MAKTSHLLHGYSLRERELKGLGEVGNNRCRARLDLARRMNAVRGHAHRDHDPEPPVAHLLTTRPLALEDRIPSSPARAA